MKLGEIKNILPHYFVTKADSNYETNRKKISFDCPFKKDTEKSLESAQYDTARNFEKIRISRENENEIILTHW